MILDVNSQLWRKIYHKIVAEYEQELRYNWKATLANLNIKVLCDIDGRVEHIMLPENKEELTILLLRWA